MNTPASDRNLLPRIIAFLRDFITRHVPVEGMWRRVRSRKVPVAAAAALFVLALIGLAVHDLRTANERKNASDQLALTRTALRGLLEAAGQTLATYPGSGPARIKLASIVQNAYQNLAQAYPTDRDVQAELAQVYLTSARLDAATGQFEESRLAYQKALDALNVLARDPARGEDERRMRAELLRDRGRLYETNGYSGLALLDFEAGLRLIDNSQKYLDPKVHRNLKATTLCDRSLVLLLRGNPGEALADAAQGVMLMDARTDDWGTTGMNDTDRLYLAMALAARGAVYAELERRKDAEDDFVEAVKIYRGIPATSEHDASAQDQIARALIQLGESLAEDPRQRKRARDCFDEALFLLVPLASKFADYTAFRRDQVAGFTGRSRVYIALGSLENAKQDCEAGRALLDGLTTGRRNADYEILRAQSLEVEARIKDLTGARDAAQELRRLAENVLQYALTLDKERAPDRRLLERLRGATSAKAAALP